MKELTKAEEQIMQILWRINKGFVHDILSEMDEPLPAYNTVSTIVRILEKKKFVDYVAFGKTHEYFPLVSKKEYTRGLFKGMMTNYFSNSYTSLASFFAHENNLSVRELEEIKQLMEDEINKQKEKND